MAPAHDVTELLDRAAADHPDKLALVEPDGRGLTWVELHDQVERVAAWLEDAGLVAGHRVLVAMGNRLEFVTSYLGVLRGHLVAVPVNPGSTAGELARMIADSGARVVLADDSAAGVVREAVGGLAEPPTVVVAGPAETAGPGETAYAELLAAPPRGVPRTLDPEALAVLLYTSGTSGSPRAAMLSHRALLANLEQVATVEPPMIHGDDVVLGVLPLFHVYGLNAVLGGVLRHQAKLLVVPSYHPERTLDLIDDEACSVVPVAPPVFGHWLAMDALAERLGPVRLVVSGSAPLAGEVAEEFTRLTGLPVHQGYGLTEAAPVVTSTLCSRAPEGGTVGAALPGIELRLVDEDGEATSPEDPGEIQVRGANLFSGYWPHREDGPDEDGWWRTGDIGLLDPDGDLTLVDRVRELIIVSGFNVYPAEVEDVIEEVPGVREVAVIGGADDATGEAVVAYLRADRTQRPEARAAQPEEDLVAAVREHCAERLAGFKRPTRIELVEELPRTVTGKVQKGRLRTLERRRAPALLREGS